METFRPEQRRSPLSLAGTFFSLKRIISLLCDLTCDGYTHFLRGTVAPRRRGGCGGAGVEINQAPVAPGDGVCPRAPCVFITADLMRTF